MRRSRRNDSKRREANRSVAPSNFDFFNRLSKRPDNRRSTFGSRRDPYQRVISALGPRRGPLFGSSRSTKVDLSSPNVNSPQKSKKYSQPNWSSVDSKKSNSPTSSSVCSRRQARKEVIFATGNAGRKGQKSPVWTEESKKRCK